MQDKAVRRNSFSTRLVSLILSWMLSVFLALTVILSAVSMGFLNRDFLVERFCTEEYYENIRTYFYDTVNRKIFSTGISAEEALGEDVSVQQIERDITEYVNTVFEQGIATMDTTELSAKIVENLKEYMQKNGIEETEENLAEIHILSEDLCEQYAELTALPFLSYYVNVIELFEQYRSIVFGVCGGVILFIMFLLLCLYPQDRFEVCRYYIYALTAALLMGGVIPVWVLATGIHRRLNLSPEYFYLLIVDFVDQGMRVFFIPLLVCIILLALISIAWGCQRAYRRRVEGHSE